MRSTCSWKYTHQLLQRAELKNESKLLQKFSKVFKLKRLNYWFGSFFENSFHGGNVQTIRSKGSVVVREIPFPRRNSLIKNKK